MSLNIIIDAMGGDNAPEEIVRGVCAASLETDSKLILVGDENRVKAIVDGTECRKDRLEIVGADSVITMDDAPMSVVRAKKDSSMSVGLRMVKESGDAFVSAGNTGALHAGATLIVKNIKGIRCAAIATLLPFEKPMLMMDSGANINVTSDNLLQWAYTGSVYMKNVMKIDRPTVGLLNNGTEECKGTALQKDAFKLLSENGDINFCGNIEAKQIPFAACDVLVTDGFTGNVVLKLIEGMSKFMLNSLKGMFTHSLLTKMSYLAMKGQLRTLKHTYDASEHGGAPILGISKPVIKAHGSSDARAVLNAVKQAELFCGTGVITEIEELISALKESEKV